MATEKARHSFPSYLIETHQPTLASSGVGKADGQHHVRTEGVELSVSRPHCLSERWWGPRGDEKPPPGLKGICEIPSLEIPCPCLLGEDNKPHTESLISQWEFVHQITHAGSGAGGSRSFQVCRQILPLAMLPRPHVRGCKAGCVQGEGAGSLVFSPWFSQWV